MKIKFLFLCFFVLCLTISVPVFSGPNLDSLYYTKQIQQLKELNLKVDSLLRVSAKFYEEKNYFTTALSSQTTIFSLIVGLIVILIGLITYVGFVAKVKQYQRKMNEAIQAMNSKYEKIEKSQISHDKLIALALGNVYAVIANISKAKYASFTYPLLAAYHLYKNGPSKPSKAVILNMNKVKKAIDGTEFKKVYPHINDPGKLILHLKELVNSKDQELYSLALYILNKFVEVEISSKKPLTSGVDGPNIGE